MKNINNKLFENFKSDEISHLNRIVGGSQITTSWISSTTSCDNGIVLADPMIETSMDGNGGSNGLFSHSVSNLEDNG